MPDLFDQLARAGTVEILLALKSRQTLSFAGVRKLLGNSTTATRRLRELQQSGVVSRRVLQDRLRTVEYRLTEKGAQVAELVHRLNQVS